MELSYPLCYKVFTRRHNLNYHINNSVCQKSKKKCQNCDHQFSTTAMLQYHIENKVCQKKEKPKITLKKETLEKYQNYTKDELILKLANLEGKYESLQENPQNINNTINNAINNVIVFPTAYGQENIDYICQKLGDIVGPLVKHQTFSSIPCLF